MRIFLCWFNSAEVTTFCLYPYTKCSCRIMKKLSNEFHQGALTIVLFWRVLWAWHLKLCKLETIGPAFSSFNSCPSLPSMATDERKQFQCLNKVLNDKTEQLVLEFN